MFHWRIWLALGLLYFTIHVFVGYLNCVRYLCPGDREDSWVLEYKDEDTGEVMIKDKNRTMTKRQWLLEQQKDMR